MNFRTVYLELKKIWKKTKIHRAEGKGGKIRNGYEIRRKRSKCWKVPVGLSPEAETKQQATGREAEQTKN